MFTHLDITSQLGRQVSKAADIAAAVIRRLAAVITRAEPVGEA